MARYIFNPERGFLHPKFAFSTSRCSYTWDLERAMDIDHIHDYSSEDTGVEIGDTAENLVVSYWNERIVDALEARLLIRQHEGWK